MMWGEMIPEEAFEKLVGLDECWELAVADYEEEPLERFAFRRTCSRRGPHKSDHC